MDGCNVEIVSASRLTRSSESGRRRRTSAPEGGAWIGTRFPGLKSGVYLETSRIERVSGETGNLANEDECGSTQKSMAEHLRLGMKRAKKGPLV